MEAILNIKMDKTTIEEAQKYATSHNKNLSEIIESYLKLLVSTEDKKQKISITPFVKSMETGVEIPSDFDYKKEYGDYLQKKYS